MVRPAATTLCEAPGACGMPPISVLAESTLREYATFHRKMLAGPPEKMRFVAHGAVHNAGLGNQLQAMISALMLGILTNRALLVDWPRVDPHSIVYAGNNASEHAGLPPIEELFQSPGLAWDFWPAVDRIPQELRRHEVALVEISNRHKDILHMVTCEDLDKAFPHRVIAMKAWDNYIPLLAHNPHYAARVRELFGNDIFRPLAHFLVRPVQSIWHRVNAIRQKRFAGQHVIGLQMRSFFMQPFQVATFWRCARFLAMQQTKPTIFFLATDDEKIQEAALQALPRDVVVIVDGKVTRATANGVKRAVVDMLLLEESDELIITAGSSFGRLAHGRNGRAPYVVTTAGSCVRQLTSEPCSRLWHETKNMKCLPKHSRLDPLMMNHEDCDNTW